MTETERQDVLKHVQLVVCQEIKEKLQKWPDQAITRNIREHQIFQKMGGCPDLLPQNSAPTVTTVPTVPELQSQATPTPPSQNNQPEMGSGLRICIVIDVRLACEYAPTSCNLA